MRDEILILAAHVEISNKRNDVLNVLSLDNVKMPKQIAADSGILPNHVSKILADLKDNGLIVCINEKVRKGRLYRLTPLGNEVKEYLKTENMKF